MKITLPTKTLASALAQIRAVAKPSRDHAILGNVAFIAEKKMLRLIGTDLSCRLEITIPCTPKETGGITLNCASLSEWLKIRSGDAECTIETNNENVATIRAGKHVGTRPGLPIEDMPQWPETEGGAHQFAVPATLLKEALTKCLLQSSTDASRYALYAVSLVSRGGKLNIQASDGRREILFYTNIAADFGNSQFLIPKESVPMLASLAESGDVSFIGSESILTASTDSASFATKLIEGTAPDFEMVIPKDNNVKIIVEREEFIGELRTAETYMNEKSTGVKIACDGKEVTVRASGADIGAGSGALDTKGKSGVAAFACNPIYLRDALAAFSEDEITLLVKDEISPILIKNNLITCVLMPLRIS